MSTRTRSLRVLPPSTSTPLPPLYARWVEELVGRLPAETEATCDDCVMCAEDGGDTGFDPSTKCCTFLPSLPNFLVGRVLSDPDKSRVARHGRATIEKRIADRIAVTPLGIGVPRPYELLYRHIDGDGFGRTPSLRCPHYIDGCCGMWKSRMSVCATWFCKHVRGANGQDFWRGAIKPLLIEIERMLARHVLIELDVGDDVLSRMLAMSDDTRGKEMQHMPDVHQRDWGTWSGREREFFIASAKIVDRLRFRDVRRIGGVHVEARARIVRAAARRLRGRPSTVALRVGSFQVVSVMQDITRIVSYSANDPLDVPNVLLPLLGRFDGRAVDVVTKEIESEVGVTIDRELVERLADFEVLVPV